MSFRIGVDTGGTFTDVALISEETGETFITKVPSTPENSSIGVLNGLKQIVQETGIKFQDLNFFIHGSTVATNTLLERKGAKTILLTTKGFKDILQIGRQTRPKLYDLRARNSEPLISRNMRWEINERTNAKGEIIEHVDEEEVISIAKKLKQMKVEAVAISFLNSFINPKNEINVKEILKIHAPNILVTVSSNVLPEIKEYERTSTVGVNAYVMPKMDFYLKYLKKSLSQLNISSDLYIMQSNGGVINTETAVSNPVRTMLSGPAGGVIAGTNIAKETGCMNMITIDMGGTSLDTALINDGTPQFTTSSEIEDYPIHVPMVEMHTIGSGGGSIAWIDSGGALRVGPSSAGANPGPVCYGKGGTEPTVSDANAILGRINPESILGGRMEIDIHSARKVVKKKIADPLGISIEEAAEGILKVINANVVKGIRVVSVEKGHDTRDFTLLAFGGAGPLHAGDVAKELGCKNIIIPPNPGVICSVGMLMADVRHDFVQSFIANLSNVRLENINQIVSNLYDKGYRELKNEGFSQEKTRFITSLDLRYKNQAYELNVELESIYITDKIIEKAIDQFHSNHSKIYGFNRMEEELEIVNIRLIALGLIDKLKKEMNEEYQAKQISPKEYRKVFFEGRFFDTPIYEREYVCIGSNIEGPAIIEQLDSTVVIHPNQIAVVDSYNNLSIRGVN